jgi:bacillithiol biosynthesis cysteine-adding enzyme BshC
VNKTKIPYHKTGYFSNLMLDYIAGKESIKPFYNNSHSIEGYKKQLEEKQFSDENRKVLVKTLEQQYEGLDLTDLVKTNLNKLNQSNSYTVTTGHQLNLFTGPLYFIYKIVSAINLAKELKNNFPDKDFVPVFWMATEDHDFEEINHFNLFGKKHEINSNQTGAVGRMRLDGIDAVFTQLEETLNGRTGLESIIEKLKNCYQSNKTYTQAVRELVSDLFGKYGLVIIDGDDKKLKNLFVEVFKSELLARNNYKLINSTSEKLERLGFKKQVNPRDINLFYLKNDIRERIVFENNCYKVLNTEIQFSETAILEELENYPENFSPNAVMRPLYQEVVLPNLAYIGGGGELAYWMQLKQMFANNNVVFPILMLRNSAMIIDGGSQKKIDKLELTTEQLFLPLDDLVKSYLKEGAEIALDLKVEERGVELVFEDIVKKAGKIDPTLQPMIKAELQKSLKSLQNIEARLIKAEKQKEQVAINQIKGIKEKLFPNGSLQERKDNFLYAYLLLGDSFIDELVEQLNPFEQEFVVLS